MREVRHVGQRAGEGGVRRCVFKRIGDGVYREATGSDYLTIVCRAPKPFSWCWAWRVFCPPMANSSGVEISFQLAKAAARAALAKAEGRS